MKDVPFARKELGQHWLYDDASLEAMCAAAGVAAGDVVLEIGPGTGTLTRKLLGRGARVVAVELDEARAGDLERELKAEDFSLFRESILKFDLTSLPAEYKLVANIPYYLTSHLVRILSESTNRPSVAVLLVQKEVAERVTAVAGDMSLLSVTAQYYWECSKDALVPARLFTPPPKVDSQILIMKRRDVALPSVDEKALFRLVKAGFAERRKKLRSSLSGGLRISKQQATALLQAADINPDMRAQELPLKAWHQLYQAAQAAKLL